MLKGSEMIKIPKNEHPWNGPAEVSIKEMSKMLRAYLVDSHIPLAYWDYVVEHASLVHCILLKSNKMEGSDWILRVTWLGSLVWGTLIARSQVLCLQTNGLSLKFYWGNIRWKSVIQSRVQWNQMLTWVKRPSFLSAQTLNPQCWSCISLWPANCFLLPAIQCPLNLVFHLMVRQCFMKTIPARPWLFRCMYHLVSSTIVLVRGLFETLVKIQRGYSASIQALRSSCLENNSCHQQHCLFQLIVI